MPGYSQNIGVSLHFKAGLTVLGNLSPEIRT